MRRLEVAQDCPMSVSVKSQKSYLNFIIICKFVVAYAEATYIISSSGLSSSVLGLQLMLMSDELLYLFT